MSQRLSESAVKGSLRWFTEDERANWKHDGGTLGRFSVPMGVRPDGRYIYPIAGASPDDPSNDDTGSGGSGDGGGSGGSEGQQGDNGGSGSGSGGSGEGADGNKKDGDTVSKADFDALMARMQAADRNKAAAEKALKELQDKDLSEQEKALKRVPELEGENAELKKANQLLTAKVAFLGLGDYSWHDPDVALAQVDLSEVFGEDGTTIDKKKLKSAADGLAKDKAFLVKSANDDKGGSGKGGQNGAGGNGQGSSGSAAGSGGRGGANNGVDEAALKQKYPALNF